MHELLSMSVIFFSYFVPCLSGFACTAHDMLWFEEIVSPIKKGGFYTYIYMYMHAYIVQKMMVIS